MITASQQTKDDLTSLTSITQQIADWAGPTEVCAFEESYFLNHVCRPLLENRVSADGFTLDPITNLQKKSQLFGKEAAVWIFNNTIADDDWVANKDSIKTIRDLHAYEWLLDGAQQDALDKTCEKVDKEVLGDLQFGSTFIALQIHVAGRRKR